MIEAKLFARLLGRRPERPLLRPGGADRRVHRRDPPPRRAIPPEQMDELAFILLRPPGPPRRRDLRVGRLALDAIRRKVRRRVEDYAGERDAWFRDWFEPTWRRIEVRSLSWEDVVDTIAFHAPRTARSSTASTASASASTARDPAASLPRAPFPVRPRRAAPRCRIGRTLPFQGVMQPPPGEARADSWHEAPRDREVGPGKQGGDIRPARHELCISYPRDEWGRCFVSRSSLPETRSV